ncbi:glycosyltransferase family 2 protein [Aerococcaceae bacterium DSM 111022]|nr:glycosyltransferase family 2 protein [Aerococcaceae bacterium DSM 111022]
MRNFAVIIPAYNPMDELACYISELLNNDIAQVIVINDGNSEDYDQLFEDISKLERTTVINHETNKGKGAGLKTAFSYLHDQNNPSIHGAVTADADGQHLVNDVLAVGDQLINFQNDYVIGIRDFTEPHVPFRSKLGNYLASQVFSLLFGYYLHDTQTGLRGIAENEFYACSHLTGEGFEYEINMLMYIAKNKKSVDEVEISTVYHEEHFSNYSTFSDSLSIAGALMRGYFGE